MFYKLKPQYILRGWAKLPYALINTETKETLFLRKEEMDALRLCDGSVNVSLPLVPQRHRDIIRILQEKNFIEPCQRGDSLLPEQLYHQYPARYIQSAHWSVTGRCNYRCKHCYMSAPDAKYGELSHGPSAC